MAPSRIRNDPNQNAAIRYLFVKYSSTWGRSLRPNGYESQCLIATDCAEPAGDSGAIGVFLIDRYRRVLAQQVQGELTLCLGLIRPQLLHDVRHISNVTRYLQLVVGVSRFLARSLDGIGAAGKCSKRQGVEPVFLEKEQAINYAENRASLMLASRRLTFMKTIA
jgi:hypothetical protein